MTRRLLSCALLAGHLWSAAAANGEHPAEPPLRKIWVEPFEIISTSNAPLLPERARQLAATAGERAARTLKGRRLAAEIRTLTGGETAVPGTDAVLAGTIRLPAPLPRDLGGAPAAFRKGVLAEARVRLSRPGAPTAEARASLDWREVRWVRGFRMARLRPTEEVLEDAVRKVVDRAVRRLGPLASR